MRSFAFVLLGLALLAGLFVVFQPGTPDPPPLPGTAQPTPLPPTAPDAPRPAPPIAGGPASLTAPASAVAPEPLARTFDLVVTGGRVTSGESTLVVKQGDAVVLRVRADRDDELHVHGYDLAVKLRANETSSLVFQADRSGRFDIELHHGGAEIGAFEVQPK